MRSGVREQRVQESADGIQQRGYLPRHPPSPPTRRAAPQAHECLMRLADTITATEVNALARSLLSFASHYRSEAEVSMRAACTAHAACSAYSLSLALALRPAVLPHVVRAFGLLVPVM